MLKSNLAFTYQGVRYDVHDIDGPATETKRGVLGRGFNFPVLIVGVRGCSTAGPPPLDQVLSRKDQGEFVCPRIAHAMTLKPTFVAFENSQVALYDTPSLLQDRRLRPMI